MAKTLKRQPREHPGAVQSAGHDLWAAMDLGSNNFELLVVRRDGDELVVVDRFKDKVQLLRGMSDDCLDPQAIQRGLASIARYAQRLHGVSRMQIRAVGTYALRQAKNREDFLLPAQSLLGVSIDVLSGDAEARLIELAVSRYLGTRASTGSGLTHRLVLDIGGGSTELVVSRVDTAGERVVDARSVPLGCVSLNDRFFGRADLIRLEYPLAHTEALRQCSLLREAGWDIPRFGLEVIGTSGTVESIATVCEASGLGEGAVSRRALAEIESALVDGRWLVDLGLPGLPVERVDIFPAGVAILSALMTSFDLDEVQFCNVSLPHGVLHEAMHLAESAQPLQESVAALAARYRVDLVHGARVGRQAASLAKQLMLAKSSQSGAGQLTEPVLQLLQLAAMLHEIGLQIGVSGYHRHSAYLLQHADLRGLTTAARAALVLLVRNHRRAWPAALADVAEKLGYQRLDLALICLRIAVILERSRSDEHSPVGVSFSVASVPTPSVSAPNSVDQRACHLGLPTGWLERHPLSASELQEERGYLERYGYALTVA